MRFSVGVVFTLLVFVGSYCDAFLSSAYRRTYIAQSRPQKMDYLSRTFSGVMQIFGGKEKIVLLIIDPQVDFHPGGSLAVPGANQDSERTADMIINRVENIDEIYVTLDSHHRNHIAHAIFWVNPKGQHPAPFTIITYDDVLAGKWTPRKPEHREWCLEYTKKLKDNERFSLCIWPEHCLIGSSGHSVTPVLNDALQYWAGKRMKEVHYVLKGENCLTEMYSAIAADVEIESDPRTKVDPTLIEELTSAKKLLICGQAKSHCVAFTTRDILKYWVGPKDSRIILLTDATSPVPGFEAQADEFVNEVVAKGVQLSTTLTCI